MGSDSPHCYGLEGVQLLVARRSRLPDYQCPVLAKVYPAIKASVEVDVKLLAGHVSNPDHGRATIRPGFHKWFPIRIFRLLNWCGDRDIVLNQSFTLAGA